ncbi:MAG: glycosyltransferase [Gemmatimonadales bacterium]|nr:MAG: glycosyltransferase [Gemmatimonadales bacterium]
MPDPDPGPDAPAPRVVVVPRRLFRKNGVEYVIRALPALVREVPGALLLLVGDGPERDRIEALARELGVSDRIHLAGRRPHHEMPGWLSSGEIAVFPSLMEATSVAALEAMACRRPVVASRVGGLPQIVDEEVGRLVEPANPEALARALADLLRDPNLAERGRRARARVEAHWSNARLVRRHLEVYRALVEGTPVPSPATPQSEPGPTP